jgi:hypothetical protein
MEINGTVVAILPMQTGQGRNGPWKKQEFILEQPGQYPKKVCISLWGEKIDQNKLTIGEKITVSVNLESREGRDNKWFTDVRAWRIARQTETAREVPPPPAEEPFAPDTNASDDLPF